MAETQRVAGEEPELAEKALNEILRQFPGLSHYRNQLGRIFTDLVMAAFAKGAEWQREEGFREGRP